MSHVPLICPICGERLKIVEKTNKHGDRLSRGECSSTSLTPVIQLDDDGTIVRQITGSPVAEYASAWHRRAFDHAADERVTIDKHGVVHRHAEDEIADVDDEGRVTIRKK